MTRRVGHLLILSLIASLPVLAGFSEGPRGGQAEPPAPSPVALEQVQLPPMPPLSGAAAIEAQPTPGPARGALAPRPPVTWVQAFRPTTLWASERGNAASLASLPQWSSFKSLGPAVGTRLPVDYPGDGASALPQRGWVDSGDVGPAGTPNPEFELATGGGLSPTSGVGIPRRTTAVWPQGISAQYAAVVDGDSGELLWGRNAHGQIAPASLTKIVTTLVALDRSKLPDRVTTQFDTSRMWESTRMGLSPGETVSMETLLFGLMLPSGNDAALAIAQYVAGSEPAFADLMNAKAAELGLTDSHFVNPHGLDADGHYSSPFDLCVFSRAGFRDATFARLAGTRHYQAEGYDLYNLNRLLGLYPKADGVKVGFTDNAGRAIVGSATQDGHRVFVALIRSQNPVPEAQALLEWAFRGFAWP